MIFIENLYRSILFYCDNIFNFILSFNDSREKQQTNKEEAETVYKYYSQIK